MAASDTTRLKRVLSDIQTERVTYHPDSGTKPPHPYAAKEYARKRTNDGKADSNGSRGFQYYYQNLSEYLYYKRQGTTGHRNMCK